MSLPVPNLDDKTFSQIAEEARGLIPSTAPEWTDHNAHDPGITFVELFAWLAEIEHYRLNHTSAASYARFLSLAGLTPHGQRPAEVAIELDPDRIKQGALVPANTRVTAVGSESVLFQTIRDTYLTTAKLRKVITVAGEREIPQTKAQNHDAGHYEAFGPSPAEGDSLQLGFEGWFTEEQGHLAITLFEADLPPRTPFEKGAQGFVPSATVRWEYLESPDNWLELSVIEDGTLHLSRSGELIFRKPESVPKLVRNNADGDNSELRWIRARLASGQYEIPPRIFYIATNTIRARQVETIVNEDLGAGLGTPDQVIRLKKAPLFLDQQAGDGPFQIGEVLDWNALVMGLARPEELYESQQAEAVKYVAERLRADVGDIIDSNQPLDDDKKRRLALALDKLLDAPDFYRRKKFPGISIPEEFQEPKTDQARACQHSSQVRRFNRFLLQRAFPDLIVSDRVEIQTGTLSDRAERESRSRSGAERAFDLSECEPGAQANDESKRWSNWERVEDFSKSAPEDRHYLLEPETGRVLFGNGLNGRAPQTTESIRARFHQYSQGEKGNLSAGQQWRLVILMPDGKRVELRGENLDSAAGGTRPETLDDAKARSREVFRTQRPVMTAKDYEVVALKTPGLRVARAKVMANFNSNLKCLTLPGEVTVVVVPQPAPRAASAKRTDSKATPPDPSKGFLSTVRNHLETRRLVTTNIHVIGPQYVPVIVRCRVFLKKGASAKDTLESIGKTLDEFLDPIHGGPERNAGWPFGRSIFPSEIHQQLAKVAGVDYVAGVKFNEQTVSGALKLPRDGLHVPGEHQVELVPFERRRQSPDERQTPSPDKSAGSGCCD